MRRDLREEYSPLYFLAALGSGGLAVSFFIYLMFMVDHPDTPMVTFNHLWPLLLNGPYLSRGLIALALSGIAFFTLLHIRFLVWNIREYRQYRKTETFRRTLGTNAEVALMAIPLTLAMSINVAFVNGAVFVPNLWSVVEYLFPVAIIAFAAVGGLALWLYTRFFTHILVEGFGPGDDNSLGQMVAIFAFAMISVGFAAPGAMSHHPEVNATGIFLSIFFGSIAVALGIMKFIVGFQSMMRHGVAKTAGPSLWIVIPILTLLGIATIRITYGLYHGFDRPVSAPGLFVFSAAIISVQILFGLVGYLVMRRTEYFVEFIAGDKKHPGSYSLICPGVAFFVFGMFFLAFGLVKNDLIDRFTLPYFIALLPLMYVQLKTVSTMFRLNRKLLFVRPSDTDLDGKLSTSSD